VGTAQANISDATVHQGSEQIAWTATENTRPETTAVNDRPDYSHHNGDNKPTDPTVERKEIKDRDGDPHE
jgi:hypothetical protein